MRRRKQRFIFFLLSILSFAGLAYLILFHPPSSQFSIFDFQFSIILAFFFFLLLSIFSFIGFLTNHTLRAGTYATTACLFFYLQLINLAHPFFLVLLAALLITLELLFRRNR